jgi:hypothetical protein
MGHAAAGRCPAGLSQAALRRVEAEHKTAVAHGEALTAERDQLAAEGKTLNVRAGPA